MSARRPWFPFYPNDYRLDTLDLSMEQHGAYFTLLVLAWNWNGAIPSDMTVLKRTLQGYFPDFHGNKFNALVPPLLKRYFFIAEDGFYHQKRVDRELEKASILSRNARENAEKRWSAPSKNNNLADATAMLPQSQSDKEERKKVIDLDLAATRRVPERGAVTEYDLVLSDGGGIITHEEFQALNEEFGITNARDRASAAKRGYLSGVKNAGEFMNRFRSALITAKNRSKIVKKTVAQQVDAKSVIEDEYAERQRRLAARNRIIGGAGG